jgi:hypothetical protein
MKARRSNPDDRELELSDIDGLRRFKTKQRTPAPLTANQLGAMSSVPNGKGRHSQCRAALRQFFLMSSRGTARDQ